MTTGRDAEDPGTGPIFLGGAGRSGKTLVRWMLSSHPGICISRRTEMWPRFYGRFGDLAEAENLERCLEAMVARRQIAELEPDLDRVRREFRDGPATYGRLFALLHEQYGERCGKPRWGDQTGLIERFADEIVTSYPSARFIHMIRDPRDRYAALLERGGRRPGLVGQATGAWLTSASLARRNATRYPSAYRVLRYETLVTEAEETMRDVCTFLEEEFEPAMLRMEHVGRYDEERAASTDGSAISTAYIGRYRDLVARGELAFIQSTARDGMAAFGYALDPVRLSPSEKIRYAALRRPVNLVRMGRRRAEPVEAGLEAIPANDTAAGA